MIGILTAAGLACIGTALSLREKTIEERVNLCVRNLGLGIQRGKQRLWPTLHAVREHDWGTGLTYQIPYGLCLSDFTKHREELEHAAGCHVEMEMQGGFLHMKCIESALPNWVRYSMPETNAVLPLPVGHTPGGFLLTADLVEMVHVLIGGATGGGKSNWLHQALYTLEGRCEIRIIDLKRMEFSGYEVAHDLRGALEMLGRIYREMHRRQAMCAHEGVTDIRRLPAPPPYIVLVVDEFAQLCPEMASSKAEKELRRTAHGFLADILALARAVGIHCLVATQHPYSQVVPGLLKNNFGAVLAFRTLTQEGSKVLIGHSGAEKLPAIPGRAIWQRGHEETVVQVMLAPTHAKAHSVDSEYAGGNGENE